MGTKESNGDGLRAMNILQLLMLAVALGMGGWVVRSIQEQGREISEMKYQLRDSTKNRWSALHQNEYNFQLGTLNATLRTPDVRKIVKDTEP